MICADDGHAAPNGIPPRYGCRDRYRQHSGVLEAILWYRRVRLAPPRSLMTSADEQDVHGVPARVPPSRQSRRRRLLWSEFARDIRQSPHELTLPSQGWTIRD